MGLSDKERELVVQFRLEKAKETFLEIKILTDNKLWRNAANRLYYACFYVACALLIKDGYKANAHNGVKTVLVSYVKDNRLSKDMMKLYGNLFNMRHRGDYEDWVIIEENDIMPLIEPARQFIETLEKLIVER